MPLHGTLDKLWRRTRKASLISLLSASDWESQPHSETPSQDCENFDPPPASVSGSKRVWGSGKTAEHQAPKAPDPDWLLPHHVTLYNPVLFLVLPHSKRKRIEFGVPVWLSRLGIQHCHCHGSGHCYGAGSIPGLGTSSCLRCS